MSSSRHDITVPSRGLNSRVVSSIRTKFEQDLESACHSFVDTLEGSYEDMSRSLVLSLYRRMLRPQILSKEFLETNELIIQGLPRQAKRNRFPTQKVGEWIKASVREGFRENQWEQDEQTRTRLLQEATNLYILLQRAVLSEGLERKLVKNALKTLEAQRRAARRPGRKKLLSSRDLCKDTTELLWNTPWSRLCRKYGFPEKATNFSEGSMQSG